MLGSMTVVYLLVFFPALTSWIAPMAIRFLVPPRQASQPLPQQLPTGQLASLQQLTRRSPRRRLPTEPLLLPGQRCLPVPATARCLCSDAASLEGSCGSPAGAVWLPPPAGELAQSAVVYGRTCSLAQFSRDNRLTQPAVLG